MAAADSLIGAGLAPSPYAEAVAEVQRLTDAIESHNAYWRRKGCPNYLILLDVPPTVCPSPVR